MFDAKQVASSSELREALARAIAGGYATDSIDLDLYYNDPVYHAVVYEVRRGRLLVDEAHHRGGDDQHGEGASDG